MPASVNTYDYLSTQFSRKIINSAKLFLLSLDSLQQVICEMLKRHKFLFTKYKTNAADK